MKVFISHSSNDKKFVRTLKDGLKENSIETWVDEDQLDLGDSLVQKLDIALEESTHFVIILSQTSVSSNWVQFELKKAIKQTKTGLINKIIPILYKECEIPEELSELLYHDLSKEIVLPEGNRVKFLSNGYDDFFVKLIRAIRNANKQLTATEKNEIKNSLSSKEIDSNQPEIENYVGINKLIGYASIDSRSRHQEKVKKKNKNIQEEIRPIFLPNSIKDFWQPEIGERLETRGALPLLNEKSYGHFAGFQNNNVHIVLDKRTRDECNLEDNRYYELEINKEGKYIYFANQIKTIANI